MLNNLDLFKIRLITELTRHQSLAGAAKQLGITSSAVSQNIRSLERSLGKPLFLRVGKGVRATPLAIEIAKKARPFFDDLADLLEDSHERVTRLKIGAPIIFGTTTLIDRVGAVHERFPGIEIGLTLLDTKRLIEDLLDGRLDFAFIDGGPHLGAVRELATLPFSSESLVLCCSTQFHRAHLRHSHSIKTLKSLPHVPYHQEKEGIYKWYHHHYRRVPDFKWTFAVDNAYGVRSALLKNWGLGVLPKSLLANDGDKLVIIPGPKGELKSEILLAQNKSRVPTKLEKAVISLLLQAPSSLPGRGT